MEHFQMPGGVVPGRISSRDQIERVKYSLADNMAQG